MEGNKKITAVSLLLMLIWICSSIAVFAADKSVTAQIPVTCVGTNSTEAFQYIIQAESSEFQSIEAESLSLRDGEKGSFCITFTYPGTYHYSVQQVKGKDADTSYDTSVYQVDVYVTENENGELFAQPILYAPGANEKKAELSFDNLKVLPEEPQDKDEEKDKKPAKKPGGKPAAASDRNVKTGDQTEMMSWIILLVGSAVLAAMIMKKFGKGGAENA